MQGDSLLCHTQGVFKVRALGDAIGLVGNGHVITAAAVIMIMVLIFRSLLGWGTVTLLGRLGCLKCQ